MNKWDDVEIVPARGKDAFHRVPDPTSLLHEGRLMSLPRDAGFGLNDGSMHATLRDHQGGVGIEFGIDSSAPFVNCPASI